MGAPVRIDTRPKQAGFALLAEAAEFFDFTFHELHMDMQGIERIANFVGDTGRQLPRGAGAEIVEGRAIDVKSITDLASMPSKEEILSKLLFLINAPAQRLVTAMNAVGRNLAVVIDQGCKENKFQ